MELSSSSSPPSAPHSLSTETLSADLTPSRVASAVADAAQTVLRRRFRVVLLVRDAYEHMTANASALQAVQDDLKTMLRLLLSWVSRSYARVPWSALVMIAGAVCYFVMPVDLIPDVLGPLGFVDDAAVIGTVVQSVRAELDRFRSWEQGHLPETTSR